MSVGSAKIGFAISARRWIARTELSALEDEIVALKAQIVSRDLSIADLTEQLSHKENEIKAFDAKIIEAKSLIAKQADAIKTNENNVQLALENLSKLRRLVTPIAENAVEQIITGISEAESSVEQAIRSFTDISHQANELSVHAQMYIDGSNVKSATKIGIETAGIMNKFVDGLLDTARQISKSSRQLDGMMEVSDSLAALLDEIEGVADQTMMLSLNASIEAARAGAAGAAFGVVANEVSKLSDRSRLTAERMRSLTSTVQSETSTVLKELGLAAEQSLESSCEAQSAINSMITLIQDSELSTQEKLGEVSYSSQEISENIKNIIVAFQFHDLLRQRLELAAEPLCKLHDQFSSEDDDETVINHFGNSETNSLYGYNGAPPTLRVVNFTDSRSEHVTLF